MATPFSAPDEAILTSTVALSELTLSSTSSARKVPIDDLYDLEWLADQIHAGSFQRVALQFPDELLCDSSDILWSLQAHSRRHNENEDRVQYFILADTSYGNCCVDEVAAEHIDADLVVHFGHACLSLTSRLPVIYIFHKLPIDVQDAVESLLRRTETMSPSKKVVLRYDVGYEHAIDDIKALLELKVKRQVVLHKLDKNVNFERYLRLKFDTKASASANDDRKANTSAQNGDAYSTHVSSDLLSDDTVILYIGPESLALTNLLLKLGTKANVISYDPSTRQVRDESGSTNKLLQRRYFAVQKARDAHTIALLVGTLGLRSYLPLISKLRKHLTEVQKKKVYTISVGKLNPAKLANFQEIDVFVLIACPENSLIEAKEAQRSKDYFRPIVTPFELMMAFKGREWTGDYILNLETVFEDLPKSEEQSTTVNGINEEEVEDEPHFSLLTGGLVSTRDNARKDKAISNQESAELGIVTVRDSNGVLTRVMDSAGGQHIASRSWRGLEPRLGMDEAAPLEIGRSGIAKGYVAGNDKIAEGA